MNKHFLKQFRDNLPESLKYIMAPVIRKSLINNNVFRNYYKLLNERELFNSERIRDYQLNELKKILIHSYQTVPYYQALFKKISFDPYNFLDFEQIKQIPFLTREIITDNFNKLISTIKVKGGYYIGTTSGSTSVPLKFLLDYDSIYKENAFIYYYRRRLGYNFEDKLVTFRKVEPGNRLWKINPMYNELMFFPIKLSKITIAEYVRKINDFKPAYLHGYLSAIWYFTKLVEEYNLKINVSLKGIFFISENINIEQRQFIEQFFNVKSLTFYGHSERCVIAEEMLPARYMFDPYYGYTEQIPIRENNYSIVGTGFLNYKMPLIRYKTDDVCFPEGQFYSIEGKRVSNMGLYGINNEFIASTSFELEEAVFNNITNYQFIQDVKGKADLHIIVNKDFKMAEFDLIKKEINRQTKGIIKIDVKIVESLRLSPGGKYQMYISNIGKS